MVFRLIWVLGDEERSPKGLVHNLHKQVFMLDSSKMETPEAYFFDIATAQNDSPMYLTHILDSIYVLSTSFVQSVPWGRGGGGPKGLVQNLLMQLFTLGNSKIKVCEP